jgi:hypothetical protein
MNKLTFTKCQICGSEKTARGISQHIIKSHGVSLKDYIVKYVCDGVYPTCKCGCGTPVTIRGYNIMDYVDGHSPAGRFKKGELPKRNYDKWLTNVTEGIQKYNIENKQKNPKYRSGEKNNFFNKHHSLETKEVLRRHVEHQIINGNHAFIGNINGRIGKSSLETKFEQFLLNTKVDYVHNYKIAYDQEGKLSQRYKYYDFYIPSLNKLIELHGSYWHPKQLNENLSDMQIKNYYNDEFKTKLASKHGYELDIVYDTDLDNYINCFYTVFAERVDVEKLQVEI